MTQERAELTRSAFIAAAARCFELGGYERTKTLEISRAAAMSKGSLTFHFDTKLALATAVQRAACTLVQHEAELLSRRLPETPLQRLVDLTHLAVDHLDRESPLVRAAVRLSRELDSPDSPADPDVSPQACWRRVYTYAAQDAERAGQLGNITVEGSVVLALSLTDGVYEYSPSRARHHCLAKLWQSTLTGLTPSGTLVTGEGEAWMRLTPEPALVS